MNNWHVVLDWLAQEIDNRTFHPGSMPMHADNQRLLESFAREEFATEDEWKAANATVLKWMKAIEARDMTSLQRNPVITALERAEGQLGFVNEAARLLNPIWGGMDFLDMEDDDQKHLSKFYSFWSEKTTAAPSIGGADAGENDDPGEATTARFQVRMAALLDMPVTELHRFVSTVVADQSLTLDADAKELLALPEADLEPVYAADLADILYQHYPDGAMPLSEAQRAMLPEGAAVPWIASTDGANLTYQLDNYAFQDMPGSDLLRFLVNVATLDDWADESVLALLDIPDDELDPADLIERLYQQYPEGVMPLSDEELGMLRPGMAVPWIPRPDELQRYQIDARSLEGLPTADLQAFVRGIATRGGWSEEEDAQLLITMSEADLDPADLADLLFSHYPDGVMPLGEAEIGMLRPGAATLWFDGGMDTNR